MNIYLVSRDKEKVDYDEADAWVVVAKTEEKASEHCGYHHEEKTIELIGTTTKYKETTEILESFNAG